MRLDEKASTAADRLGFFNREFLSFLKARKREMFGGAAVEVKSLHHFFCGLNRRLKLKHPA